MIQNSNELAKYDNEFSLPFGIDVVKNGIKDSFSTKESKILGVSNQDDVLNIYRIVVNSGVMRGCIIEMNLKKVDEESTVIKVMATNAPGNKAPISVISGAATEYIQTVVKLINGELKPNKAAINPSNQKGCGTTIVIGFIAMLSMSFLFL